VFAKDERIYVFQMQSKYNNFVSKSNPNPKIDSFNIQIIFQSNILSLLLGYVQFNSKIQKNILETNSSKLMVPLLKSKITSLVSVLGISKFYSAAI